MFNSSLPAAWHCFIFVAYLLTRDYTLAHPIRHARHLQNANSNNNNHHSSGDYNSIATFDTCDVPNACNRQGRCVFLETGRAKCDCLNGFYGIRCEIKIEPVLSVRCFHKSNQANACPVGEYCMLDDFRCLFMDCPDAQGFCVRQPNVRIMHA